MVLNEHTKVFNKLATKILLIILVLSSLGIVAINRSAQNNTRTFRSNIHFGGGITLQGQIADAQERQFDGWEWVVARYSYMLEHGIEHIPTIMSYDHRVEQHPEAWRTEAVYILFQTRRMLAEDDLTQDDANTLYASAQAMDEAIRTSNWLQFTTARLIQLEYWYHYNPAPEIANLIWATREVAAHNAQRNSWQHHLIEEMQTAKNNLARATDEQALHLQDTITIGEYRLANNIPYYTYRNMELSAMWGGQGFSPLPEFWLGFAFLAQNTVSLIGLFLIIIAGGIIASEYAGGTIKSLLINPVARWKFLVAKYVTIISVALILLFILFMSNLLFTGLFYGFSGINAPFLNVVNGEVVRGSAMFYTISLYLLGSVGVIVLATFAFMLSALVRSSALAIGLGVCLFFGGFMVVQMLQFMGFYQARFIFFANTDLIAVMNGSSGFVHHTLTFAIIIIAVHMLIFLWTAWDAFTRTDVK